MSMGDHTDETDGWRNEFFGSVRCIAVEEQGIARHKPIGGTAVLVVHLALEHVDQLVAHVLEQGKTSDFSVSVTT